MVKKIITGLLIITAAWLVYLYLQGEDRKVKKRFERLSELISKEGGESAVVLAQRARSTGKLFYKTCIIEASDNLRGGNYTPEQIASHTASARAIFKQLSLKFYDLIITFPSGEAATVRLTGILSGTTKEEELFEETHEMEVALKKVEGEWFFSNIKAVEVLER